MQSLMGAAHIWAPVINGGDSSNILNHIQAWMDEAKADIVHINCGLHDIKRTFANGSVAVPLEEYKGNIRDILTQLASRVPHVIWAMTTPVNYQRHHAVKEFDRFDGDVQAYNMAAQKVTDTLSIQVNDLYALIVHAGRDNLLLPDGVHFTAAGYVLLAKQVCDSLQPSL
jgi:lysophospholipase L1-like esterase